MKVRLLSLTLILMLLALTATPTLAQNAGSVDLSGLESLALVGKGIPGIQEWDPGDPAGDMTEISPGIYTKVIFVQKDAQVQIKFAGNDRWDEQFNFGFKGAGSSFPFNSTLELDNGPDCGVLGFSFDEDCNLKFTVDLTGTTPTLVMTFTDEEPNYPLSSPQYYPITVYAKVPDEWCDVRIWAYNDSNQTVNQEPWPGEIAMTDLKNGWYCAIIPGWATKVIINANGGETQTSDIPLKSEHDIRIYAQHDPLFPTYTYDKIPDTCAHILHDQEGCCLACSQSIGHQYDNSFSCYCGVQASQLAVVYFKKADAISKVYIQWSNKSSPPAAPGGGMEMTPGKDGIYSCKVPADVKYVFFSNGSDIQHAEDFQNKDANASVFDYCQGIWVTYEEATAPVPQSPSPVIPEEDNESDCSLSPDHAIAIIVVTAIVVLLAAGIATAILIKKKKR